MTTTISTRTASSSAQHTRTIASWVLQVGLAAMFVGAGLAKLSGDPAMIDMFADIGAGQWLRYVVGSLELAGGVGLLVPRLAGVAALGLALVMIGAAITNVTVLDASPALPLLLLVVAGVVAWMRRTQVIATARSLGYRG